MADTLTTIHSLFQYVAIIGVVMAVVAAARSQPANSPFIASGIWALRVQVILGLLVWIFGQGWSAGLVQGYIHPIIGIAALGAVEAGTARARRDSALDARPVLVGYVIAALLVIAAIGLAEVG